MKLADTFTLEGLNRLETLGEQITAFARRGTIVTLIFYFLALKRYRALIAACVVSPSASPRPPQSKPHDTHPPIGLPATACTCARNKKRFFLFKLKDSAGQNPAIHKKS